MNKHFLITLAAGKTGFATANLLLQRGHKVTALVRTDNENARTLQRQGATICYGTFDNEVAMRQALSGVDRVYYC